MRKNRLFFTITAALTAAALLCSCGNKQAANDTETENVTADTVTEIDTTEEATTPDTSYADHDYLSEDELMHDEYLENSLYSVGNTERFQKAVAKAKAGEEVNIVYLGGSITYGTGASNLKSNYAYLSFEKFIEKYAPDSENVHYYNEGIPGTPSTLGVIRSEKDVLSKNPDIVFIEFAVNDSTDSDAKMMYESLVKRILDYDSAPAVILICNRLENGYTAQDHMKAIGDFYDLGIISVADGITPLIDAGEMTFKGDYAADEAHPNDTGHAMIADMIAHYFDHAYNTVPTAYSLPEGHLQGTIYANAVNIGLDSSCVSSSGSFVQTDISNYTYDTCMQHNTDAGNEALTFTAVFSKMAVAYEQQSNTTYGTAVVMIDGKLAKRLNGYSTEGWGNIDPQIVYKQVTAEEHTVTIYMDEGSEDKLFKLMDIIICE